MSLDSSQLQVSVEERERWRRVMSVTIPASIVQEEERKAARQLASRAKLKGFRQGRVPARLIEERYGGALRREALDKLIGSAYREALASEQLRPISEGEIADVQYQPEQDLTFEISFDVEPEIGLERLGGFAVERRLQSVADEQVQAVLERVREQNGAWRPFEEGTPTSGDLVSVNIVKLDDPDVDEDGRDYDFIMGQGDAIPGIEEAIATLEPSAEGEFEITFPDDFPDESRRGDKEHLRIKLTGRRVLELPDLDDDLARQVGDFESLDELKARIREDLEKEAEQAAENAVRSRLVDLVIEANPLEVPASMVERYVEGVIGQAEIAPERLSELKTQLRPEAERAVKRILVIDRIAHTQGLSATEDDVDGRVEEIAAANEASAAKVYAELQKAGRLEAIERELTEKKVFEFLKQQSEIIDAPEA